MAKYRQRDRFPSREPIRLRDTFTPQAASEDADKQAADTAEEESQKKQARGTIVPVLTPLKPPDRRMEEQPLPDGLMLRTCVTQLSPAHELADIVRGGPQPHGLGIEGQGRPHGGDVFDEFASHVVDKSDMSD